MPATLPLEQIPDVAGLVLKLGGTEVERSFTEAVVMVDVHEEIGRLARAKLVLDNWDEERREVRHSDGDELRPGTEIELQLGWEGEHRTVFDGVVTGLEARFPDAGAPTLVVSCRCRGSLLAAGLRSRVFEDATDGDAVGAIAGDHGLTPEADDGPTSPFLVQAATTDWDFLRERQAALGHALYVRGTELHAKAPAASGSPVATLEWGSTLLELRLRQEEGGSVATTVARAWDPEALAPAEAEAVPGDAGLPTGERPGVEAALGDAGWDARADALVSPGSVTPDELDARARAGAGRGVLRHINGQGRTTGLPQLRIDSLIELTGVGRRLSGVHYLTAVRHTLTKGGYFTEFQVGWPETVLAPPEAGGQGAIGPLVTATVDDIDDPNGWGRVRVLLPWLDGEIASVWARLAVPAAGAERGFFFIPEVGDEVVVGFLGGEARFPVVLGSTWNGTQAPPESLDAATNAIRSIVSRTGHRLTLDDSDGAAQVKVETAAGQSVLLDDTSGGEKVALEDKTGNKITMSSSGIALEAAAGGNVEIKASGGKVALEGTQFEAKSTGAAKVQSSAALDLQASATLGITGALVKINS